MKALWIVVAVLLSGCSNASNPVAPQPSAKAHPYAPEDWAPLLQRLDVRISGPHLMIQGLLDERAPVPFNGGWSLQMLLDTDQNDATGYTGHGYDYAIIGPYRSADGTLLVQIANASPPTWGDVVAHARFVENGRHFSIAVPLRHIGDDGRLDWYLHVSRSGRLSDFSRGSCAPRYALR